MAVCLGASVCSKVEEFRREGKYSDVSIHVRGRIFKCHRIILAAASLYFDKMFCGNFKESYVEELQLNDIDSEIFEEILQTIYSGNKPNITDDNAFNLLYVSEFLSIQTIRDPCIEFILDNKYSVDHVIEMFVWARRMNILPLIDPLLERISNEFISLSEDPAFLEMPFEDLQAVLFSRYTLRFDHMSHLYNDSFARLIDTMSNLLTCLSSGNTASREMVSKLRSAHTSTQLSLFEVDDLFADAIVRWLHYSYAERKNKILITIKPSARVSTDYLDFLSRKYRVTLPMSDKQNASFFETYITHSDGYSPDDDDDLLSASFANHQFLANRSSIHLYLEETIFSINKYKPDGFISHVNKGKPFKSLYKRNLISSSESDYVYFMNMANGLENPSASFRAYSSIDLSQSNSQNLCPPPVLVGPKGALGETSKQIYCSWSPQLGFRKNPLYTTNYKAFTKEQLKVGVFYYNCERDEWFTFSQMKLIEQTQSGYQPVVVGDLVYFICSNGNVQACDIRSSRLLTLPSTINRHERSFSCCVLNGKIYVSDRIEVFDPTMQKWEILRPSFDRSPEFSSSCIVSYNKQLWCFDKNIVASSGGQMLLDRKLCIEVYNPRFREWYTPHYSLAGQNIIAKCGFKETPHNKLDGVIVSKCT